MQLNTLAGNPRVLQMLGSRQRGLPHACLISGPVGSGRHTLADLLSAAMVCQQERENLRPCLRCSQCKKVVERIHPDVIRVAGEGNKPITVDQIRDMRTDAYIRPNEGRRKIYLLENAGELRTEAQNAMLKLLEEGPEYAAFLLLCENPGSVLQTIRSRCEQLPLSPVPLPACEDYLRQRFPEKSPDAIRAAALNCQGILGRAVEELTGDAGARRARQEQAEQLAALLCTGDELTVLEGIIPLEKLDRAGWTTLLTDLEEALVARLARGAQDGRRALRCVELCRTLKEAAALNTNPGQLSGWLCAGIFE